MVIAQSGGPTMVINQSLIGAVLEAKKHKQIKNIYGSLHGIAGILGENFIDLRKESAATLEAVAKTPSSGLGSVRKKPTKDDCLGIFKVLQKYNVRYFFYIGGNDSSDTCRIIHEMGVKTGYELRCFHVPKTVDNDLVKNDHTPGFPSAARFVAMACMADFLDNVSLPGIKINVIMGRHAGFLTAASALARRSDRDASTDGPQLIYVPEVAFDIERFIGEVEDVYAKKGRCHIAVSEGIQDANGQSIGASLIKNAQVDAHGNAQLSGSGALGDQLADLLKTRLTPAGGKPPRVRADTFGYIQRCWPDASVVDRIEARRAGRQAAVFALQGHASGSVAIVRTGKGHDGETYASAFERVELRDIAAKTRHIPPEFLDGTHDVSQAFLDYCRPLVGDLPNFERL
jgi:6-phosphofructokinase 1